MHYRALCICCSGARKAARRGGLNSSPRSSLGCLLLRHGVGHSAIPLQSIGQVVQEVDQHVSVSASISRGASCVLEEELQDLVNVKPEEARNVFIDDLSATLKAHRAANRASVIRKVNHNANSTSGFENPIATSHITPGKSQSENASLLPSGQSTEALGNTLNDTGAHNGAKAGNPVPKDIKRRRRDNGGTNGVVIPKEKRNRRPLSLPQHQWPAGSLQNGRLLGQRNGIVASEPLEYEATHIVPNGEYKVKKNQDILCLENEIKSYEKFMKLGPIEHEAARLFAAEIKSIVRQVHPDCPLLPIGSWSTGLADRLSDFDFTLSLPNFEKSPLERGPSSTRPKAKKIGLKALEDTRWSLVKSFQFLQPVAFIHARVPIVKAVHRKTDFRVEIQALGSHEATQELSMAYLAEFPTLRPLYIIFRSALHIRHLNIVHEGGLGSYSILMMIVNALKHASGRFARDDVANHFLHVLDFYSTADLYKYGYSPDPPRLFPKQAKKMSAHEKIARLQDPTLRGIDVLKKWDPKKPYLLCLQDPANPINDLGSKAYGIKHVQKIFSTIREGLRINMAAWEGDGDFEEDWQSRGLLAKFLGADYSTLENKRRHIESWVREKNRAHDLERRRQAILSHVTPEGKADLPQLAGLSTQPARDLPAAVSGIGELRVNTGDVLEGARLEIRNDQSSGEIHDQVDMASSPEPNTSAGYDIVQEQPVDEELPPSTIENPESMASKISSLQGDVTGGEQQRDSAPSKAKGSGWKRWSGPADKVDDQVNMTPRQEAESTADHANLQEQSSVQEMPPPTLENSEPVISNATSLQGDVNGDKPLEGFAPSYSKLKGWRRWSPPTEVEGVKWTPPREPPPRLEDDQRNPHVEADKRMKESSVHRASARSHSAKTSTVRNLHTRSQPVEIVDFPSSIDTPPPWWSKHLRPPPDPRMWHRFPRALDEMPIDMQFVEKLKALNWLELAALEEKTSLAQLYGRKRTDEAEAITLLVVHHIRSALWQYQPKALKPWVRQRFQEGSVVPYLDNQAGRAALSVVKKQHSMPLFKDTAGLARGEGATGGRPAAISGDDQIPIENSKASFMKSGDRQPGPEDAATVAEVAAQSTAPVRPSKIKIEDPPDSDADEDLARLETPIEYEAPVPNLDYFNKREEAFLNQLAKSGKMHRVRKPGAKGDANQSRNIPPAPGVSKLYWPPGKEQTMETAMATFQAALDTLTENKNAKAGLLGKLKNINQELKVKPDECLRIELKTPSNRFPFSWYDCFELVKVNKRDRDQIESSGGSDLAASAPPLLFQKYLRRESIDEHESLKSREIQVGDGEAAFAPSYRDRLAGGKYFRVHGSDKAPSPPQLRRGNGEGFKSSTISPSEKIEHEAASTPDSELSLSYEALQKLKAERGWGKYRDPDAPIEPLPGESDREGYSDQPSRISLERHPDDDISGTGKFFHKAAGEIRVPRKTDNTPEQDLASQRAAEDKWTKSLQPTGHVTPLPASDPPTKDVKTLSKNENSTIRIRGLGLNKYQDPRATKKAARIEKQRVYQEIYKAVRGKARARKAAAKVGTGSEGSGIDKENIGIIEDTGNDETTVQQRALQEVDKGIRNRRAVSPVLRAAIEAVEAFKRL